MNDCGSAVMTVRSCEGSLWVVPSMTSWPSVHSGLEDTRPARVRPPFRIAPATSQPISPFRGGVLRRCKAWRSSGNRSVPRTRSPQQPRASSAAIMPDNARSLPVISSPATPPTRPRPEASGEPRWRTPIPGVPFCESSGGWRFADVCSRAWNYAVRLVPAASWHTGVSDTIILCGGGSQFPIDQHVVGGKLRKSPGGPPG